MCDVPVADQPIVRFSEALKRIGKDTLSSSQYLNLSLMRIVEIDAIGGEEISLNHLLGLDVSSNFISSLDNLPNMPNLKMLSLASNIVNTLTHTHHPQLYSPTPPSDQSPELTASTA